jgi:hypothetical protein
MRTSLPEISNDGDFLSIINRSNGLFGFHHLEFPEPASSEFVEFNQNPANGELTIIEVTHMDWSSMGGLWTPCAGSISP